MNAMASRSPPAAQTVVTLHRPGDTGRVVRDPQGHLHGYLDCRLAPLAVCETLRIKRHKVFRDLVQRGESFTGWFYGFQLHAVINHQGELLKIKITADNVDDRKGLLDIVPDLSGKPYADKGHIGKAFMRKNMLSVEHSDFDKVLLSKRSLVETVFDELKNLCQIEHARHRSLQNSAVNLMGGIVAYGLFPVKPRIMLRKCRNPPATS